MFQRDLIAINAHWHFTTKIRNHNVSTKGFLLNTKLSAFLEYYCLSGKIALKKKAPEIIPDAPHFGLMNFCKNYLYSLKYFINCKRSYTSGFTLLA
jgi:hypothetical protein